MYKARYKLDLTQNNQMLKKLALATGLTTVALFSTVGSAQAGTTNVILDATGGLTKLDYFGAKSSGVINFTLDGFYLPNDARSSGAGPATVTGSITLTDAAKAAINADSSYSDVLGDDDIAALKLDWTGGGKFIPEAYSQSKGETGVSVNDFSFDFSKIPAPSMGSTSFVLPLVVDTSSGPETIGQTDDGEDIVFTQGFQLNLLTPPSKAYQKTLIASENANLEDLIQETPNTVTYKVTVVPEPSQIAGIAGLMLLGVGATFKKRQATARRASKAKSLLN